MPNYLTPEGAKKYADELNKLLTVERPRIVQEVQEAAAQGDRSENAEYTYGKKRLREIDRRVRFLRKRLDGMTIVDKPPSDRKRVFFGAWVTLEDEQGNETRHRIVGPDEFDQAAGYISMDAPWRAPCCARHSTMNSPWNCRAARAPTPSSPYVTKTEPRAARRNRG